MEEPIKKEEFLEQIERERAELRAHISEPEMSFSEMGDRVEQAQAQLDEFVERGDQIQNSIWALNLRMAALLVAAPVLLFGRIDWFAELLGGTLVLSGLGLAGALYCLAKFFEGKRIWILAFGLLSSLLVVGNTYFFYTDYRQGQAEELAWALHVPEELDYAFELLRDKEHLRQQNVLSVSNIRPGGECDFGGPTSRKPIHFAAASGDLEILKLLLADEDLPSNPLLGNALLLNAALSEKNSLLVLKMLLEAGVSPNHPKVVIKFILDDNADKLQLLLDQGLDPDCSVPSDVIGLSTTAYKAARKRKAKKCRRLLRRARASRPPTP